MEKTKYHKPLLEIIDQFRTPKVGILISKKRSFNGLDASLSPFEKGFKIEFQHDNLFEIDVGVYYRGIKIKLKNKTYNLESVFLEKYAPPKVTGSIDRINTLGFSEKIKYYFQLIIPLKQELRFDYNIEKIRFTTDLGYYSRTATTAKINGEQIQACCIHDDKKRYFLAISSHVKQTFNQFAGKANAVKRGIGYLSGHFAGDQGYFFAYTKMDLKTPKHFRFVTLRDSIKSNYSPVFSNAYGYIHRRSLANKYYTKLRPVSLKEFSLLCEKIHNSLDFSSAIMLIFESSVASLLFMPGAYAIALER